MLFSGVIHPEQLTILTKALQQYCDAAHIEPGTPDYSEAGRQIIFLFECGIRTPEKLVKAMLVSGRVPAAALQRASASVSGGS